MQRHEPAAPDVVPGFVPLLTRASNAVAQWSARWVPNSFAIACLLTLVTFALVIGVAGKHPIAAEGYWVKGFWELLELTMQLSLIVLTGYVVAVSPVVCRLLEFIAGLAASNRGAVGKDRVLRKLRVFVMVQAVENRRVVV